MHDLLKAAVEKMKAESPIILTDGQWEWLARRAFEACRNFDVLTVDTKYPVPMFFDAAWEEVFDAALSHGQSEGEK